MGATCSSYCRKPTAVKDDTNILEDVEQVASSSSAANNPGKVDEAATSAFVNGIDSSGGKSAKAKIAAALLKAAGEGAMKEAILAAAQPGPLDVQKVYDAALEGAKKGAKVFGAKMGAKGVNVAILEASQYAAIVVLSEATKEAGRQTVYYGAGTATQTALAGVAGVAGAVNPMIWASIVGELSGKTVAWATEGDPKVAGIVGSVGAGALAGAYVGSSFGPAGTLAGLAGGVAVGTTQHLTSQLIEWFLDQAEDYVEENFLDADDDKEDDGKEDGTDWRPTALERMGIDENGLLKVKLPVQPPSSSVTPLLLSEAAPDPAATAGDSTSQERPPMLLGGKLKGVPDKPLKTLKTGDEPAAQPALAAPGATDVSWFPKRLKPLNC